MNVTVFVPAFLSCVFAALSAACMFAEVARRRRNAALKRMALGLESITQDGYRSKQGAKSWSLRYAESLTRGLYTGATEPLSPAVRAKMASKTRAGKRFGDQAASAGCEKEISVKGFLEARARLGLAGMLVGLLIGAPFTIELSIALGLVGFVLGRHLLVAALRKTRMRRAVDAEQHLSEMLEVVALGLRSGLSFDLSFALYGSHFEGPFATSCEQAYRRWALGLSTREESLRQLARSYDCEQLGRVVDGVIRSLKLGTSLTGVLEDAASQARASYRAKLEERVAKAPVKMMLPTGTLILPAMLLLVIGPVLLELAGGF